MIKVGVVKEINGNKITVSVYKEDACAYCSKCSEKSKTQNEYILYNVENKKIELGDFLTFEIETKIALKIGIIVYILPLIIMILSYFTGMKLYNSDEIAIVISFCGLFIFFIFIYFYDRSVKQKISNSIKIISIDSKEVIC